MLGPKGPKEIPSEAVIIKSVNKTEPVNPKGNQP